MKRRSSFQYRSWYKWQRRILLVLLLSACLGFLVFIQANYNRINLLVSMPNPFVHKPKIAFLFIARNRLPLDFVWDEFFRVEKENKFSIFVHSRPGFLFNEATTKSIYFLNRQVNDSVQVDWGGASMIQAERILLKNALMEPSNERFVFLSDSCIPLYNFSYTYDYIMSTPTSFVDSFADTKDGRYNPKMHPVIPVQNWRKGSQWAVLTRKHAEVAVKDDTIFPVFQLHCKRELSVDGRSLVRRQNRTLNQIRLLGVGDNGFLYLFYGEADVYFASHMFDVYHLNFLRKSLPEFWRDQPFPTDPSKEHNCIPDEHYVQTLLAEGLEGEITRRSLTHTAWDLSGSKDHQRQGWHPSTYKFSDATPELIQSIRNIDNIYYETEYRREWCTSKGKPSKCFLFARKFSRPAGLRLLNMAVLGASSVA